MTSDEELKNLRTENAKLKNDLHRERVGGQIINSPFVRGLKAPPDFIRAALLDNFRIADGKTFAVGRDGVQIYSRKYLGQPADVEEAIEVLIAEHPHSAYFKNGTVDTPTPSSATQTAASPIVSGGGKQVVTRAAFAAMRPSEQMALVKGGAAKFVD